MGTNQPDTTWPDLPIEFRPTPNVDGLQPHAPREKSDRVILEPGAAFLNGQRGLQNKRVEHGYRLF